MVHRALSTRPAVARGFRDVSRLHLTVHRVYESDHLAPIQRRCPKRALYINEFMA